MLCVDSDSWFCRKELSGLLTNEALRLTFVKPSSLESRRLLESMLKTGKQNMTANNAAAAHNIHCTKSMHVRWGEGCSDWNTEHPLAVSWARFWRGVSATKYLILRCFIGAPYNSNTAWEFSPILGCLQPHTCSATACKVPEVIMKQ